MKTFITIIIGVFLAALLITWVSVRAVNSDAERFDRVLAELDRFSMFDAALHRDVLAARAGLLRNYDPLVHETNALYESLDRLRALTPTARPSSQQLQKLAASVAEEESLVERFKSDNALLQNSLAYFTLFSDRLDRPGTDAPLVQDVTALAAAMLRLAFATNSAAAGEVEARLDALARQSAPPGRQEAIAALLAHGTLLQHILPSTDGLLKALSATPERQARNLFRAAVLEEQASSRAMARKFRVLLYLTGLLLIAAVAYVSLRLRSRALALQRRAMLEQTLDGIAMRFINSQPQDFDELAELAVAEIAKCIGADRGYFFLSGTDERLSKWCADGISFPANWPEQVRALRAKINPALEGLIYVPRVSRLKRKQERNAFDRLGLKSWACASSLTPDNMEAVVGFDALRRPWRSDYPGEFNLLATALDMLTNTARRGYMERERARLEERLQQARRMETVGALASGIAHNFNNIIAAILGHAEMAEAKFEADRGAARHLAEIRRAAERARDLIGQILDFGRPRDNRRQRVRIKALLDETAALLSASLPSTVELAIRPASPSIIVRAEAAQLQQVILNLCANAAQAMDGQGRIEIATQTAEINAPRPLSHGELAAGSYVSINVSDSGRGMDDLVLERIFEPFFTTRPDGNGLGLATAREIVRECEGAMHVRSAPGKGSTFEVWLPCEETLDSVANDESSHLPLGHGETLLVLDDNREQLLRSEEILAALGYEPVGFMSIDDALNACRAIPHRFDALVVGHLTSANAALDVATELHKYAPHAPILLATPSVQDVSARRLMMAGVFEVVSRPIAAREITTALNRCFTTPRHEPRR